MEIEVFDAMLSDSRRKSMVLSSLRPSTPRLDAHPDELEQGDQEIHAHRPFRMRFPALPSSRLA